MTRRTRKLIGAILTLGFVVFYALAAMGLAQSRPLQEADKILQIVLYGLLGSAWILPLMPLIKWMERPDGK